MQVPRVKHIWEALVWDWHCSHVRIKLGVQTVFPSPPPRIYSHRTKPSWAFLLRFCCSVMQKSQRFRNPSTKSEALQIAFQPLINAACSTREAPCQLWSVWNSFSVHLLLNTNVSCSARTVRPRPQRSPCLATLPTMQSQRDWVAAQTLLY